MKYGIIVNNGIESRMFMGLSKDELLSMIKKKYFEFCQNKKLCLSDKNNLREYQKTTFIFRDG